MATPNQWTPLSFASVARRLPAGRTGPDIDPVRPSPFASRSNLIEKRQETNMMSITRRQAAVGGMSLLAGTSVSTLSRADLGDFLGIGEGLEDFWLATDAYIYGYPLVTVEMTRRVATNVAKPEGTRGPMGN